MKTLKDEMEEKKMVGILTVLIGVVGLACGLLGLIWFLFNSAEELFFISIVILSILLGLHYLIIG